VVLLSAFLDDKVCHEASGLGVAACVKKEGVPALPELIRQLTAV
jgi:hypothetical protein